MITAYAPSPTRWIARPGKVRRSQMTTWPVTWATVLCGRPSCALTLGVVNSTLRNGKPSA